MRTFTMAILMAFTISLVSCGGGSSQLPSSATQPEQAVTIPVQALINNDIAALVKFATTAEEYAEMQSQWSEAGQEMPTEAKAMINTVLGNPGAVDTMVMPMVKEALAEVNPDEMAMGIQMMGGFMMMAMAGEDQQAMQQAQATIQAFANHIRTCGINDPDKARKAITAIVEGAGKAGITSIEDFVALPLDEALKKLPPVVAAVKDAANVYGFDINGVLRSIKVTSSGEGDTRQLSISGTILGQSFTLPATVRQVNGQWTIDDGDDDDDDFDFDFDDDED